MLFLRSFDACYHAELQDMWYKAHYKEAEKIRARPLGEYHVYQVYHLSTTQIFMAKFLALVGFVQYIIWLLWVLVVDPVNISGTSEKSSEADMWTHIHIISYGPQVICGHIYVHIMWTKSEARSEISADILEAAADVMGTVMD